MKDTFVRIFHKLWKRIKQGFESLVQCILIALDFFNKNGLANHAAASAYGFLFSAAPALLIVSFVVSQGLKSSPETAASLIGYMGLLSQAFDMEHLIQAFLSASRPGIAGIISIVGLLWTARIFALSLQRGLGVIFPDTENKIKPVKKMITSIIIEGVIILFTFITVLSSKLSLIIPLIAGFIFIFLGYTFVPANITKRKAAIAGTIFCIVSFTLVFLLSSIIFNPARFGILYGTLGNLLVLLVNVYFFFMLFFLGAELTFIIHSFDALLLSRFIQTKSESKKITFTDRWFASTSGALKKYLCFFEKGKVIFHKDEKSNEIYYILSGSAEVYLENGAIVAQIEEGKFFGEMGHVLSEGRSATIKARTDLEALVIPADLFEESLKYSSEADQKVIAILSERLKNVNEKLGKQ